jgi:hypothetical protein
VVLGFELRAFTLSNSTSSIFEIGSCGTISPGSFSLLPPELPGLQAWDTLVPGRNMHSYQQRMQIFAKQLGYKSSHSIYEKTEIISFIPSDYNAI